MLRPKTLGIFDSLPAVNRFKADSETIQSRFAFSLEFSPLGSRARPLSDTSLSSQSSHRPKEPHTEAKNTPGFRSNTRMPVYNDSMRTRDSADESFTGSVKNF